MTSPSPPTFTWPLRLAPDGSFATVPQDSATDIGQSLTLLLTSRVGERVDEPDYGIDEPAFGAIDTGELEAAAAQWEPRADTRAVLAAAVAQRVTVDLTATTR